MSFQSPVLSELHGRLSDQLGGESAISAVSDFLVRRTRLEGRPFSFADHEFQIQICNDPSPYLACQKPTQVGMTELTMRIALALLCLRPHFPIIYVLPSEKFAGEVSKARIDPIIENSDYLTSGLVTAANSALMKRIYSSVLYMAGAATKSQAISRPAKGMIHDEVDFCNQSVLTAFMGRLRHTRVEERWIRKFSTPTVPEYGISKEMDKSDRKRYMARCTHCGTRQAPDFYTQVTIPGWDGEDFNQFTKDDLRIYNCSLAYLRCIKCGKDLDEALRDAVNREWVSQFFDRDVSGYEVKPFDLISRNPIPQLVLDLGEYDDEADYHNFVLGETRVTNENQVNRDAAAAGFILPSTRDFAHSPGLGVGIDVGEKRCHFTVGRRVRENGKLITQCLFRAVLTISDGLFREQIAKLLEEFGIDCCVMDQRPDYSLSGGLMEDFPNVVHAANYRPDRRGSSQYWDLKPNGMLDIERTRGFNTLVQGINSGEWQFSVGADKQVFLNHLLGMKRVKQGNTQGEMKSVWVKTGDDHYLHSCMYLSTALDMIDTPSEAPVPVLPSPVPAPLGGALLEARIDPQLMQRLRILTGIGKA